MVGSRKEAVRVFVDTNVDASILLIENLSTTIGDVKSALHGCIKYIKNQWVGWARESWGFWLHSLNSLSSSNLVCTLVQSVWMS